MGCLRFGSGRIALAQCGGWQPAPGAYLTSHAHRTAALVSGWEADCIHWIAPGEPGQDLRAVLRWWRPQAGNQRREREGGRLGPVLVAGRSVAGVRLEPSRNSPGQPAIHSCGRPENGSHFSLAGFGGDVVSPLVAQWTIYRGSLDLCHKTRAHAVRSSNAEAVPALRRGERVSSLVPRQ